MFAFLIGLVVGAAARHYYPELRTLYYAFLARRK